MVSLLTHICVTRPQWVKLRQVINMDVIINRITESPGAPMVSQINDNSTDCSTVYSGQQQRIIKRLHLCLCAGNPAILDYVWLLFCILSYVAPVHSLPSCWWLASFLLNMGVHIKTHLPLVPHIHVREPGQHWFRLWLVARFFIPWWRHVIETLSILGEKPQLTRIFP